MHNIPISNAPMTIYRLYKITLRQYLVDKDKKPGCKCVIFACFQIFNKNCNIHWYCFNVIL